jgi:hypothetical protein
VIWLFSSLFFDVYIQFSESEVINRQRGCVLVCLGWDGLGLDRILGVAGCGKRDESVASSFGLRSGLRQCGAPLSGWLGRGAEAPLYPRGNSSKSNSDGNGKSSGDGKSNGKSNCNGGNRNGGNCNGKSNRRSFDFAAAPLRSG